MKVMLVRPKPHKNSLGLTDLMTCEPIELEYVLHIESVRPERVKYLMDVATATSLTQMFAEPAGIAISNCLKIGSGGFRDTDECDFRIMRGGRCGTMANPPPDYRAIPSEDWLKATAEYWATLGL